MKEETRKTKQTKRQVLNELKREARANIWQLGKWGYSVDIEPIAEKVGWKEMDWGDIYSFESFWISEDGRYIFKGCTYFELRKFTKLVKRYKHNYGVKKLHSYTDEIILKIRNVS